MDIKIFLQELLSALAKVDFIKDVDLKTEGMVLSGKVLLQKDIFLEVYHNAITGTIVFALIKERQRIWGVDRDNIRDWHTHPLDDPKKHVEIEPLSVSNVIEILASIWEELG